MDVENVWTNTGRKRWGDRARLDIFVKCKVLRALFLACEQDGQELAVKYAEIIRTGSEEKQKLAPGFLLLNCRIMALSHCFTVKD